MFLHDVHKCENPKEKDENIKQDKKTSMWQ